MTGSPLLAEQSRGLDYVALFEKVYGQPIQQLALADPDNLNIALQSVQSVSIAGKSYHTDTVTWVRYGHVLAFDQLRAGRVHAMYMVAGQLFLTIESYDKLLVKADGLLTLPAESKSTMQRAIALPDFMYLNQMFQLSAAGSKEKQFMEMHM